MKPLVIVTGARRGVGADIALEFASRGFNVAITDVSSDGSDDVITALTCFGVQARFFQSHLGDVEYHSAVVEQIHDWGGPITCLVNNAGTPSQSRGDILNVTPRSFDKVQDVNLRGTFFFTQAVARHMLASTTQYVRSVITISSANAETPHVQRTEYCLSMSGLGMMTRLYAMRLAPLGIGVFEIRPCLVRSFAGCQETQNSNPRIAAFMGRWGFPQDVAYTAAALAEGKLGISTGSVLRVDGSLSLKTS
jgi:NAD(P)-dependent dehydrogenase (short-subunit alcohol dehydrogenase family)